MNVSQRGVVFRHAYVVEIFRLRRAPEAVEAVLRKSSRDFAGTVRAEVDHDYRISVLDSAALGRAVCIEDNGRKDEFVVFLPFVSVFQSLQ